MITDARVLQPEFVPREVRNRSNKIDILTNALEPVTAGDSGETTMIFGSSGVGKTCIARYTLEKLRENALDVQTEYVNAWEDHTRFKLLYRILEGINRSLDIHRQSTPTDKLLDRIRDYDEKQYVVIIDEVDQLEDKKVLYDLYHISNLTMILIGNREEELFSGLDERLTSRLTTCSRIQFEPYSLDELVAILWDRVKWGLEPSVIDEEQLVEIADAAAGDARKAIGILRQAAKKAHRKQTETITDDIIQDAIPAANTEIKQKSLDKLTEDQRLLCEIIEAEESISPKELYNRYEQKAADPVSERMVRNHLSKMEHYNLVQATGATRSRTYELV